MTTRCTILAAVLSAALGAVAAVGEASACACCTNTGQRNIAVDKLDPGRLDEVRKVRFGGTARLFLGEAEPEFVKGIATPAERYTLTAAWADDRLVFTFRDPQGHNGTLALPRPATLSVFEVDPRSDRPEGGHGPVLYKEWKLTAVPSGTGVFAPGLGPRQRLTLILQGGGNSCTTADHFSHWTLVMQGPKANYTLFGDLVVER